MLLFVCSSSASGDGGREQQEQGVSSPFGFHEYLTQQDGLKTSQGALSSDSFFSSSLPCGQAVRAEAGGMDAIRVAIKARASTFGEAGRSDTTASSGLFGQYVEGARQQAVAKRQKDVISGRQEESQARSNGNQQEQEEEGGPFDRDDPFGLFGTKGTVKKEASLTLSTSDQVRTELPHRNMSSPA